MRRWDTARGTKIENPKIDAFLAEVVGICRKHGLSISHEDGHGAFEIEALSEPNIDWLNNAHDSTRTPT